MAEPTITYRGTVYPWHCDHMGHMNVMWYVGKFDEATWHFFHALGITPALLAEGKRGMAGVEQSISYRHELFAGDVVTVHTTLIELKEKSVRFRHEMRKADTGEVAATTVLTAVHLDRTAHRACAFLPEVHERAKAIPRAAAS